MVNVIEGSHYIHKYNAVYVSLFPGVVYVLRQDCHGIYRCSLRSSSKVVRWQEVVCLDEVAQQFCDDAFDYFPDGAFEGYGLICIRFGVIWLG